MDERFPPWSWRRAWPFWIALAAWLAEAALAQGHAPELRPRPFAITEADRAHWSFQPLKRSVAPPGAGHPVDAFISLKLRRHGLDLAPPASPREQVRRGSFDLLGLPPNPADVEAFERDPSDAAWAALVDRWLASPHYGERWGRHWLDLVRYAESNGYERDGPKPHAWRYRDYVIGSFNADKPYDQFVREQLAGDEIAEAEWASSAQLSDPARQAIIATGFYRLHVWDDEPDDTKAAEYDDLDDMLSTAGTAFLGLTVGCARCHDHKYDPLAQGDYYSLMAFLHSIDGYGLQHRGGGGRGTGKITRPLASRRELAHWAEGQAARVRDLETRLVALGQGPKGTPGEREALTAAIQGARNMAPPFDQALVVAENGPVPVPTRVLMRGDARSPGGEARPRFPAVLAASAPAAPSRPGNAPTTGLRSVLADWIASASNPLTPRVMINRVWQPHFGRGLAPTPDDLGRTGLPPTHPELLDHLAAEFVAGGWSLKRMHRLIMTSRAYRMSSRAAPGRALDIDEANALLWRQNPRRLEAEAVRDTWLAVSGTLNRAQGGPSVYPTLPPEVHTTQDSAGKGWQDSPGAEQNRRSVYLVVKRALKVPLLECLDFANSTSALGQRPVTTVAPQALMLLNDPFARAQARAFAARLTHEAGHDDDARIRLGFRLAVQRSPGAAEQAAARSLLEAQRREAAHLGLGDADLVAWESLCRAWLNLNEVVHVD